MKCKKCGRKNLDKDDFVIVDNKKVCVGCAQEEK